MREGMEGRAYKFEGFVMVASFLWGTSFVVVKIGVDHVDPFLFSLLRFLFGAVLLLAILYFTNKFEMEVFKDKLIWAIALVNAVAHEFQHVGIGMTTATNSTLLVNINVVFVALLAVVILREKISSKTSVALVLGILGVVILTTEGDLSNVLNGTFLGNVMVFTAGLLWAVYIIYQKKILNRQVNVLMVTGAVVLLTTLFLIPMTFSFASDYSVDAVGLVTLLYAGLLSTGIAFLFYNSGLKHLNATVASIILLFEIVFAMIFAFIFLQEVPTLAVIVGALLIVSSILTISIRKKDIVEEKT